MNICQGKWKESFIFVDVEFLPGSKKIWQGLCNGLYVLAPPLVGRAHEVVCLIFEASHVVKCPCRVPYMLCQNLDFFYEDFADLYPRGFTSRPTGELSQNNGAWLPHEAHRKRDEKKQQLLARGIKLKYAVDNAPAILPQLF